MTPAINCAKRAGVHYTVHDYQHDPNADSYGLEAVEKLGLPAERVFKTLVAELDSAQLVVAIVPVERQLDLKALAKVLRGKKAVMAEPKAVMRSTGYVLGGVSPLGQRKRLATVVDQSAESLTSMFVSAGRRGLEIELKPEDLRQLVNGQFAAISR